MKTRRWLLGLILMGLLAACGGSQLNQPSPTPVSSAPPPTETVTLTVSAAASLDQVLPEVVKLWEQETGNEVTLNFGSTGQLAQQIERGAPVDLFMAADKKAIEDLEKAGLILSETKALYGVGRITLWQKEGSTLELKDIKDLTKPEIKRVAIANPESAPYGIAAREALQSVGIWDELQPKLILGENIKQTQQYVETGNVDVAIVALANSVNQPGKWVLIPAELHKPLEQMLAVPKSAIHPEEAKQFAAFINDQEGRSLMQKYGFVLPGEEPVL